MFQTKHDWQTGLGLVRRGGKRRREPGSKRPGVSQETRRPRDSFSVAKMVVLYRKEKVEEGKTQASPCTGEFRVGGGACQALDAERLVDSVHGDMLIGTLAICSRFET